MCLKPQSLLVLFTQKPCYVVDLIFAFKSREGNVKKYLLIPTNIGPHTVSLALLLSLLICSANVRTVLAQTTFAGNSQHTNSYTAPAQTLNTFRWLATNDF